MSNIKARQAFWDVALGNNSKLANLAKMAIKEAEDEAQQRKPLTDEQKYKIAAKFEFDVEDIIKAVEDVQGIKE